LPLARVSRVCVDHDRGFQLCFSLRQCFLLTGKAQMGAAQDHQMQKKI
jgi:hypothetical protein